MKFTEALLNTQGIERYLTWIVTSTNGSMQQSGRREVRLTVTHPNPILDKEQTLNIEFDEWDEGTRRFFQAVPMIGRFKSLADLLCPEGCLSAIEECLL
jgi:hypothetical protein